MNMRKLHNKHTHIRTQKSILIALMGLFLLCGTGTLRAAPVDEATARTVAANVLGVPAEDLVNRTSELGSNYRSLMYLYVPGNGVGFVLVSADDRALPVLAYSTTESVNASHTTDRYTEIYWLLDIYKTQLNDLKNGSYTASPVVAARWAELLDGRHVPACTPIAPLMTTTWDQSGAYQQLTPLLNRNHCLAGSAALAMAQVMKYYNYPEQGSGTISYTNAANTTPKYIYVPLSGTYYAWDNMPDKLDSSTTMAQDSAVALLIYHAGVSVQTRFHTTASLAPSNVVTIESALRDKFQYHSMINAVSLNSSNADNWNAMLMEELSASRPVIYRVSTAGRFVFTIDGCDDQGYYHINFGRGGDNNGYYVMGSLNPINYIYTGGNQTAIRGIVPPSTDSISISVETNNSEWGSVSGGGRYLKYDEVTLTATPIRGARFSHWSDGNTDNPRRYAATEDRNDTAVFVWYGFVNVSVEPNNPEWGSVSGGGTFAVFEDVTLTATPVRGARFSHWSDGSTDNPRRYVATENRNDTAVFVWYGFVNVSVEPNNPEWGRVRGGGVFAVFEDVTLTATPVRGAQFSHWSDGSTDNPRRYVATEDRNDTAVFVWNGFVNVSVKSNNPEWGSVSGSGVYAVFENVTQLATAVQGAYFSHWSDGNTDNPRRYVATENRNDTATFVWYGFFKVSVEPNNPEWGSVGGGGHFLINETAVLSAVAAPGYQFSNWSDGSTDNPRRVAINKNRCDTAVFVYVGGTFATDTLVDSVYIDDRENHSWSYYSDSSNPVRSLNPADVKITYYGYGKATMYSSDAASPAGSPDVDVAADQVAIGIDVPDKRAFVYWKTLERRNGATATSKARATAPCLYRTIPNPFSIRPTYGSGNTRWRGFYKWRLRHISGGTLFADKARTQMVPLWGMVDAEQELYIDPAGEYGMEIEFEAIWARAFVFEPTSPTSGINRTSLTESSYASGVNAYERNFVVLTESSYDLVSNGSLSTETYLFPNKRPATITAVYPDGTDGSSTTRLSEVPGNRTLTQHFFCEADTKFEYISITSPKKTFTGNGYNFTMGRGIAGSGGGVNVMCLGGNSQLRASRSSRIVYIIDTIETTHTTIQETIDTITTPDTTIYDTTYTTIITDTTIYDTVNTQTVYSINPTQSTETRRGASFRIESGVYKDVVPHWCGRNSSTASTDWDCTPSFFARHDASSLTLFTVDIYTLGNFTSGAGYTTLITFGNDYDRSQGRNDLMKITNFIAGSWKWCRGDRNSDEYLWNVKSGDMHPGRIYGGSSGVATIYMGSIGSLSTSHTTGRRKIEVEGGMISGIAGGMNDVASTTDTNVWIRIRGGLVRGPVFAAGDYASAIGHRRIVITGGTVNGWVAGGANGNMDVDGKLDGDSYIYIGGTARLEPSVDDPMINFSKGGNVFGAGSGNSAAAGQTATVGKVFNSTVVIADSCYIARDVYGGGNYGGVTKNGSRIYILGGTVAGKVFGGSNQQGGKAVELVMRGGQVVGGIHGGSNLKGLITGPVSVRIEGGTVGEEGCADDIGNVFGCGYGSNTSVTGDVEVVIGREDARTPHVKNPLIHRNVYCGGYMGAYNATKKTFKLTTYNGCIHGSIFGGGYGNTAVITGNTNVNILGTTYVGGNVYGGGNKGKVTGNTKVIIGD